MSTCLMTLLIFALKFQLGGRLCLKENPQSLSTEDINLWVNKTAVATLCGNKLEPKTFVNQSKTDSCKSQSQKILCYF